MADTLMWRSTSRFHDWKDGEFVTRLIGRAVDAGIIERVDWVKTTVVGKRCPVQIAAGPNLAAELFGKLRKGPRVQYLEAGADGEFPWTLHLLLSPYDEVRQVVDGMAVCALQFDGAGFAEPAPSKVLAEAFRSVHTPDDTEYAGMHWLDRWDGLNDTVYNPAVTYTPMFSGVMWANFFGPGHIDQFDEAVLHTLPAGHCSWVGERGLFLIDDASLAAIREPKAEDRLAELTAIFRSARRNTQGGPP
ncbi:hypothetical protein AB2N08_03075 [Massilia aurea]|uniref:hypothetical protein n=1 Tax=Massilia aurea TaxID=373040 RepID=UPI003462D86C